MKTSEALKIVMKSQDVGINKLADRLNKGKSTISERVRQDNISVSKLNELLRVLDYKIMIVPRNTPVPKDSFEIE